MSAPARTRRTRLLAGLVVLNLAGASLLWTLREHVVHHDFRPTSGEVIRTHLQDMGSESVSPCLVVVYRYTVDGARYVGDKYRSSGLCLAPSKANRDRFPPGRQIAVWYDPDAPTIAVMDPTLDPGSAWVWWLFLLLIAMGNAELIRVARARGAPAQPDTET